MKSLLLLILLLLAQQPLLAQPKSKPAPKKVVSKPPPPIVPPPPVIRDVIPEKSKLEMILENAGPPLTFVWKLNADTLLPAEAPFQKTLELGTYDATMRTRFQKEAFQLRKEVPTPEGIVNATSHYSETIGFNTTFSKNTVTLTNRETKKKSRYKLFLNSRQTKILKLQNLETGEIYMPAPFEGPTIMMGN